MYRLLHVRDHKINTSALALALGDTLGHLPQKGRRKDTSGTHVYHAKLQADRSHRRSVTKNQTEKANLAAYHTNVWRIVSEVL